MMNPVLSNTMDVLIFKYLHGYSWHGYADLNGGVRDLLGAFPMSDYCVYDEKGNYDEVSEKELFC